MKVRVLKLFQDKYTKEWYKPNQEIEISKKRFDEILEVGKLVEEVKEAPTIKNVDEALERIQESAKKEVKRKK